MKKIVSILLLAISIYFVPFSIAEDNFKVSQRILQSHEDELTMDVIIPIFEGFTGVDKVNEMVFNIYLNAIADANASGASLKAMKDEIRESGEEVFSPIASLDMNYDYVVMEDILSLQIKIYSYTGGAHGMSHFINITSNIETGEIYDFKDLFKSGVDYNSRITEFILSKIENEDDNLSYFSDYKETIVNKNGNYEFYIDGDKLVVYFGLYDISPYAYGIRYFEIDSDEIKDLLKDEVYNSIKDGNERGNINFGVNPSEQKIIRDFSKESQKNHIYDLMMEVESQTTPLEAVNFYAESVKLRNGVGQYALMDEQLRKEKYNEFKDMGFVTGSSSPWVDSYEVTKVEENLYRVKFTLKTSVPTDLITTIVDVELIEDSLYIKIKSIEEVNLQEKE